MKAAVFHVPTRRSRSRTSTCEAIGREVLVRTVASGVCHSDLHFIEGLYPFARPRSLATRRRHRRGGGPTSTSSSGRSCDRVPLGVLWPLRVLPDGRTHLCQSRPVRRRTSRRSSRGGAPVNQFANLSAYAEQMLVHDSGS